jgi:transcriptional regulator of acetoin/glycerol metabolism
VSRLDAIEKAAIIRALERHKNNVSRAAEALGLTRTSLYRRMEKYGL